jgi:hypothetical protein
MTDFERAQLELGAALLDALDKLTYGQAITMRREYTDDLTVYGPRSSERKMAVHGAYEAEKADKVGA